jgi:response regulator RpfG family c-di-GMP phosphodiesterase
MDFKMTRMKGLDMLGKIKSEPSTKRLLIAELTSTYHSAEIEKAYDLGGKSLRSKTRKF